MENLKTSKAIIWRKRLLIFVPVWIIIAVLIYIEDPGSIRTVADFLFLSLCSALVPAIWFGGLIIKAIDETSVLKRIILILLTLITGFIFVFLLFITHQDRSWHEDAAIKGDLSALRVEAEMYYDNVGDGTYAGFCNDPSYIKAKTAIVALNGGSAPACHDSAIGWCASSVLLGGGEWCADAIGYAGPIANCSADHIACQ